MNTKHLISLTLCCAGALAGCTSEPPLVDGSAVRTLVAEQTLDPQASERNGTKAPEGTDGERANAAIKALRDGVAKPKEEWQGLVVTGSSLTSH